MDVNAAREEAERRAESLVSKWFANLMVDAFIAGAEWKGAQDAEVMREALQDLLDGWSDSAKTVLRRALSGVESSDEGEADGEG